MINVTNNLENRQLGAYKLTALLGKGGMAQVWLANQTTLNRQVAVKIIPEVSEADDENHFMARFSREAKAVAQLDHPNILAVIDYGRADGFLYLVTPYVRGGNLQERLRHETLTRAHAFNIFGQILDGVKFAHQQGIVHRDLKPGNILLYNDGRAVIADFGVAKIENDNLALTQEGVVLGSPDYMAPEQFLGFADYRSDLYAMGVILFQLLTGRLPYSGATAWEIGTHHLNSPIPLPNSFVPAPFELFLNKALQKRAEDRFANAQEMQIAFQRAQGFLSPEELQVRPPLPAANRGTVAFPTKIVQTKLKDGTLTVVKEAVPNPAKLTSQSAADPNDSKLKLSDLEGDGAPIIDERPMQALNSPTNDRAKESRPTKPAPYAAKSAQPILPLAVATEAAFAENKGTARPSRTKNKLSLPLLMGIAILLLLAIGLTLLFVVLNASPRNNLLAQNPAATATVSSSSANTTKNANNATSPATSASAATTIAISTNNTTTTSAVVSTKTPAGVLKVNLAPANGTAAQGTATITANGNGTVTILVSMIGLGAGQHGFHIHQGSCEAQGPLIYDLQGLNAGADGTATSTSTIKADFATITSGKYYFDIPNYITDSAYVASCGNIQP